MVYVGFAIGYIPNSRAGFGPYCNPLPINPWMRTNCDSACLKRPLAASIDHLHFMRNTYEKHKPSLHLLFSLTIEPDVDCVNRFQPDLDRTVAGSVVTGGR